MLHKLLKLKTLVTRKVIVNYSVLVSRLIDDAA